MSELFDIYILPMKTAGAGASRNAPRKKPRLTGLEALGQAAACLRTLAHPHRLRMVQMLLSGAYTVGELAEACAIPSHMASEHLGRMRDRGLLASERRGRRIYYRVAEPGLAGIIHCVEGRFGGPG